MVVMTTLSKFGGYGSDKIATAKNYAKTNAKILGEES
jgi:hypothetical protein